MVDKTKQFSAFLKKFNQMDQMLYKFGLKKLMLIPLGPDIENNRSKMSVNARLLELDIVNNQSKKFAFLTFMTGYWKHPVLKVFTNFNFLSHHSNLSPQTPPLQDLNDSSH